MWFLSNAWILPAIMAASFLLILSFGKRLPYKGAEIGITAVASVFILALITAGSWVARNDLTKIADPGEEARHALEFEALADGVDAECSNFVASGGGHGAHGAEGDHGDEAPAEADAGLEGALGTGENAAGVEMAAGGDDGKIMPPSKPVVRCLRWFETGLRIGGGDGGGTEHAAEELPTLDAAAPADAEFRNVRVNIGTMVDGQSVMMLVVVGLISLLVHIYSTDYVNGDRRYTHYFAFLSLFTASMLFFVLSENTLMMIVGWELVGVCSFGLIGHWWEEKPNSDAALKAFITNRVGDIGLLVGMSILFFVANGSFSIVDINARANEIAETGESRTLLMVASLCLLAAVMSKSGQFILHTWLPDAMAGPTPVSALIHAATMVVAGIYMVARLYPVFFHGLEIAGSNFNWLALVGSVTALFGALLAFVQKDIKKVLAYSTVSQLGFMVAALGVGAWTAAMFHLFTHAFFKACLFLGAGSLSHACHHSFNMVDDMGGLRKIMPKTFATYMVGFLALAGIFPLSGFWSKDEILAGTGALNYANGSYYFTLVMLLIAAFCTAAYMTRTVWYAFYGEFRGHGHPHESGPRITTPLIILAVLGATAGLFNLPGAFDFLPSGWLLWFEHQVEPRNLYFLPEFGDNAFTHAAFNPALAGISLVAGGLGILVSYLYYWKGALKPLEGLASRNALARTGKTILENKYYLDYLYTDVIVGAVKRPMARATYWFNQKVLDGIVNAFGRSAVSSGRIIYKYIDQGAVDGAVRGAGIGAGEAGGVLRRIQTGRVQQYAALFFAAAAILAGIFVLALG